MELIAQKLFGKLWYDRGRKYIVTVDGCYDSEFYAEDDAEALELVGWNADCMVTV